MNNLLNEKVSPQEIDLHSFEGKNRLNPKVWSGNKLRPEVKKQIIKLADDFFDSLDIPWVKIDDIRFTGSLANYNWSEYSDIDIHLIIDYKDVNKDIDLVTEYLKLKRDMWNDSHDLKIFDFDIELYAQDKDEAHASSGVYSVEDDKWIVKPSKHLPEFDKKKVQKKAAYYMNKMEVIQDLYDDGKYQEVLDSHKKLWDEIKKRRKEGLKKEGEFSLGNLVFKVLRRTGAIGRFLKLKIKAYDMLNSL